MRNFPHISQSKISILHAFVIFHLVFPFIIPEVHSSGLILLKSIEIFKTHEWLAPKPTVYFYCQGENKTILPDVKEKRFLYIFKGHESWQPLTELPDKKCKRCGLYELDKVKTDDIFDEWELCRDDFVDGSYVHYKEKEFNATFACPECFTPTITLSSSNSTTGASDNRTVTILAVLIAILVAVIVFAGTIALYKYWKKKKREQDQLRFLKLFEDTDEFDDELEQL